MPPLKSYCQGAPFSPASGGGFFQDDPGLCGGRSAVANLLGLGAILVLPRGMRKMEAQDLHFQKIIRVSCANEDPN